MIVLSPSKKKLELIHIGRGWVKIIEVATGRSKQVSNDSHFKQFLKDCSILDRTLKKIDNIDYIMQL
jgi:hypothetical protein